MSNVVLTPHIGGATYDTEVNHTRIIAEDIVRLLAGAKPLNCVNPEVLEGRNQGTRHAAQSDAASSTTQDARRTTHAGGDPWISR